MPQLLPLAIVLLTLGAGAPPEAPMRMQDAVLPVFVPGPEAVPGPALTAWLDAHPDALVKLPFTVWRGPLGEVTHAAIGAQRTPPAASVKLSDTALGVSLADRLRSLCGERARCLVSLSGLWEPGALSLRGIPERLEGEGPWRAAIARRASCLQVRVQKALHCARGPSGCEQCRAAEAGPALPKLLDLCPEGELARPVVEVVRDGEVQHRVYDVLQSFLTEAEGRAFAKAHGVEWVDAVP